MHWRRCITLFFILKLAHAEYKCSMTQGNVSCTSVEIKTLHKDISVRLSNKDSNAVEELRVTDSSILSIEEGTFINFKNVQKLYLKNTRTRYVEEGAFANLINLKVLHITQNYLESINSNAFAVANSIESLDLSHNLLKDLSDFDITVFSSISMVNLSNNRLEYLPESIISKLKEINNFYLIADNNPWNCKHQSWVDSLTDVLVAAFCTNNTYDSQEVERKMKELEDFSLQNLAGDPNECYLRCSFLNCLWWIFGAAWLGIIVGNIFKIKSLLFTRPRTYVDKNTQCDKTELVRTV